VSNNNFGAKDMVALLETLKNALRDFAAREDKLNSDFRTRSAVESRAFDAAKNNQSASSAETIAKATADFEASTAQAVARFDQRKARLNQAHINARKRVMDDITQQEADIKYSVQTGSLEAERVRDENLVATAAAFEDINRRVGESQNRFAELEVSAHKAFSGYSGFRKLLGADREWPQPDLSPDENQLLAELNRLEKKIGDDISRFRGLFPAAIFRALPIWLWGIFIVGLRGAGSLSASHGN